MSDKRIAIDVRRIGISLDLNTVSFDLSTRDLRQPRVLPRVCWQRTHRQRKLTETNRCTERDRLSLSDVTHTYYHTLLPYARPGSGLCSDTYVIRQRCRRGGNTAVKPSVWTFVGYFSLSCRASLVEMQWECVSSLLVIIEPQVRDLLPAIRGTLYPSRRLWVCFALRFALYLGNWKQFLMIAVYRFVGKKSHRHFSSLKWAIFEQLFVFLSCSVGFFLARVV